MVQITAEQAISDFGKLLEEVKQGEEFVIVQGDAPLARLSPVLPPRQPGSAVGIITYVAEDFDAPLEEFEDHQWCACFLTHIFSSGLSCRQIN